MPTSSSLVTNLPADFNTFGQAVDTSMAQLKGGTTGQILSKTSATDMAFTWITNDVGDITAVTAGTGISGGGTSGAVTITNSMATEIAASGDIIVGTGSGTFDNLPIGTTGQVLTADTTVSPYKVKWATASSSPTFVGCVVTKSTTQSIANTTYANVTWNVETFDTNGFHDNATNNSRITIPTGYGGKYYVTTTIGWGGASTTGNKVVIIRKNAADFFYNEMPPNASVNFMNFSGVMSLAVGDYIEVRVRQSSGAAVDVYGDDYNLSTSSFFSATYLGA
jgi:hypothetical protein